MLKIYACLFTKRCLIILIILSTNPVLGSQSKTTQIDFVGSKSCAQCHSGEYQKWLDSHHFRSMQLADENSVLGDFNNKKFNYQGLETLFYKQNDRYQVRTDGPDGKLQDFEIKYTFGFYPLQQYLIEFKGGRLQVLDIAWDSRPAEQGGQRWMHLHPEERIAHDDILHWTGPNLNWNYMCADCHSTHLLKNYNSETEAYQSSWSEINVACEACHGPGGLHVQWVNQNPEQRTDKDKGLAVVFDDRNNVKWIQDQNTGKPHRSQVNRQNKELNACAQCHSRRSQMAVHQAGQVFMDAYIPSLLTNGLYDADGHIADEVFVYGSFLQSKMHKAGVSCSDCHDPHSNALYLPGEQVCYQCHRADHYAQQSHHFHKSGSPGSNCIECHMQAETYMQVDDRHDHSFRIPRPDLSMTLGTKNACNRCHADQSALWAATRVKQWYGKTPHGFQEFATSFDAARKQHHSAATQLQNLLQTPDLPAIVKATALHELAPYPGPGALQVIMADLTHDDPMVRRAVLNSLRGYDPSMLLKWVTPLLADPVLAVRMEAVQLLASVNPEELNKTDRLFYQKAEQEYIRSQLFNAERPESQVNLGNFYSARGNIEKAYAAYDQAIKLQPQFVPAYANKAQLLSQQNREQEAEQLLHQGLKQVPEQADLAEALGLSLIRQQRNKAALPRLKNAMSWDSENMRYAYVYAVALHSNGDTPAAITVLKKVLKSNPDNIDILYALVTFNRDIGNKQSALTYLDKMLVIMPRNQDLQKLRKDLAQQ